MAKFTHSKFFSFIKKNWFLILITILIAFSIAYSIYKICYSADILHRLPSEIEYYTRLYDEHPEFFLQTKEELISSFNSSRLTHAKYLVFEAINLVFSFSLIILTYIVQFPNKQSRLYKICILVVIAIIVIISTPWLISCISQNATDYSNAGVDARGLLMSRIIFDSIELLLNFFMAIMIYIRHFYHKRKQPSVAD